MEILWGDTDIFPHLAMRMGTTMYAASQAFNINFFKEQSQTTIHPW
jgi:hypothetical protein